LLREHECAKFAPVPLDIVRIPPANTIDRFAAAISVAAFVGMTRWKWDIIPVVLGAGLLGLIFKKEFEEFSATYVGHSSTKLIVERNV